MLIDHLNRANDVQDAYGRFTMWNDVMYVLGYDGFEIDTMFLEAVNDNEILLRPHFNEFIKFIDDEYY